MSGVVNVGGGECRGGECRTIIRMRRPLDVKTCKDFFEPSLISVIATSIMVSILILPLITSLMRAQGFPLKMLR